MPKALNTLEPIVTDSLFSTARAVIEVARRNTPDPYLIGAKLGDAEKAPMLDAEIALMYDKPLYTIRTRWNKVKDGITRADAQHGNPLAQIAQRANDVIAQAAILNRHNRRPPLYAESTIKTFIQLDCTRPEHSPLIRAAGHVVPPPVFPRTHDIGLISSDVAAHMAASHEPQSVAQIIQSLEDRQDLLAKWPHLDLTLFIQRAMDIGPDTRGFYHPDQPWGSFLSAQRLVTSTMLRIFARNQQPCTIQFLTSEIERLVGHLLPDGYNTRSAVRDAISKSNAVSWQGPSTFGLKEWETALNPQSMATQHGRTGDLIYAFLTQHGAADINDVIKHFQQTANAKKRTIQESLNHDPADRFIRIHDGRVAANPIRQSRGADISALTVIPDGQRHRPGPVLYQSELLWLTRYVQAINVLATPTPARIALTGPRAAGFAQDEPMDITVVVDDDKPSLEPRLAEIATATSELVPSVRPNISILSPQEWEHQQVGEPPEAHHNAWLATNTAP